MFICGEMFARGGRMDGWKVQERASEQSGADSGLWIVDSGLRSVDWGRKATALQHPLTPSTLE